MSVLNAFALNSNHAPHGQAFAALIGGDLGPRLLPVGSLASLLWYDALRKHQIDVPVRRFIRIGVMITIPTMIVSLLTLWAWLAVLGDR
jgi:arsenical pump membrane protein